jgi:sugar lactone lactonase YvrE
MDSARRFVVIDQQSDRLVIFDANGGFVRHAKIGNPYSCAIDRDGNIFVCNRDGIQIVS